jgi:hypothetical protein
MYGKATENMAMFLLFSVFILDGVPSVSLIFIARPG